jgi:hypothetical protein
MKKLLLVSLLLAPCSLLRLAAQSADYAASTAYEASRVVKAAPGTLLQLSGYNSKASAQFIQVHNSATVPANLTAEVSTCNLGARTPAQLANKYFLISSPTVNYYVWFNLDAGGVDPAVVDTTAIPVAISTGNSGAQMATAAAAAIDAEAAFVSTAGTTIITITNAATGSATDIAAGDSVTTVDVTTQGANSAVPALVITAAASSNFTITLPATGLYLSSGISVCNSSTGPTKTLGSADVFFTAIYR